MHQSACRIWQCYREDTVSPSFFFLLLLLLFASRVVVRTCKMERTLAQASKPVHAPKRFAVIVLPVARNEESDSQTNGTAGSTILGRKLAQFYTVYHFAVIRVSDRKELHFAARYSELRNWYLELKHHGALADESIGVLFPSKQTAIAAVAAFFGAKTQNNDQNNSSRYNASSTRRSLSPTRSRSVGILPRRFMSPSRDVSQKYDSSPSASRVRQANHSSPFAATPEIPLALKDQRLSACSSSSDVIATDSGVDSDCGNSSSSYSQGGGKRRSGGRGRNGGMVHGSDGINHRDDDTSNADHTSRYDLSDEKDGTLADESLDQQRRHSLGAWLNAVLIAYPNFLRDPAASNFLTAKRCSSPAENAARAAAQSAAASLAASFAFEQDDLRQLVTGNGPGPLDGLKDADDSVDVDDNKQDFGSYSESDIGSFRDTGLRGLASSFEAAAAKARHQAETWTLYVDNVVNNVRRGVDTGACVFDWPMESTTDTSPFYSTNPSREEFKKKSNLQFNDNPEGEVCGGDGRETSLLGIDRPTLEDMRNPIASAESHPSTTAAQDVNKQAAATHRMSSLAALPAFSQDMGCFLIKLEDLELEAKPFAAGGSGRVYRGAYGGSPVAAKVVFSQENDESRDEFDREFTALATLHHPNVVAFFGVARDLMLGVLYTVTEFCSGGNLADLLAKSTYNSRIAPEDAGVAGVSAQGNLVWSPQLMNDIVEGLFSAVSYMHANGRAHRDLKPMNVLLTATGQVKLCDMGICTDCDRGNGHHRLTSKAWSTDHDDDDEMFTRGVGTLPYMPPETLAESNTHHSATPYDPRAWDAYSLGVMLWELWYCEPPWEGRPFHQIVRKVSTGKRPSPLSQQKRGRNRVKTRAKADDDDFKRALSPARILSPVPQSTPPSKAIPEPSTRQLPAPLESLWTSLWAQAPNDRPTVADASTTFKRTVSPFLKSNGDHDDGHNDAENVRDPWARFTVDLGSSNPLLFNDEDEVVHGNATKTHAESTVFENEDGGANGISKHVEYAEADNEVDNASTISEINISIAEESSNQPNVHDNHSGVAQGADRESTSKDPFPSPDGPHAVEAFLTEECSLKPAQIAALRDKYETLAALLVAMPELDDDAVTAQVLSPLDISNLQGACRHRMARQVVWGTKAPVGDVTFVFTNIQGSNRLWERFGPSFKPVFDSYRKALRSALKALNGYEVKTDGDAFMVAFGSASDAISFACQIQADLLSVSYPTNFLAAARNDASLINDLGEVPLLQDSQQLHAEPIKSSSAPEKARLEGKDQVLDEAQIIVNREVSKAAASDTTEAVEPHGASASEEGEKVGADNEAHSPWLWRGLRVRVGCFTGNPEVERDETTGRVDFYGVAVSTGGDWVNRAARVVEQALGGQVIISAHTQQHFLREARTSCRAQQRMQNVTTVDLGPRRLRDSAEPEHLFQVLPSFLALRFSLPADQVSTTNTTASTPNRGRGLLRTPPKSKGAKSKSPGRTRIGSVERVDAIYAWATRRNKIRENIISV